jgi:HSP20 family protein
MNNLIRFNPLNDIARYDPLMEFDEMFDRFARTALRPGWRELEAVEPQIRMDIAEAGSEYLVKAEIPGVKKDDIHVSIDGNMVSISAEVKHEKEISEGIRMLRSERCYGKTIRTFRLDQDVSEDKAVAKYADGVLELRLPKKSGATPHKEVAIS